MDLLRVGEGLLRSQPLLPFLAPSLYRTRLPRYHKTPSCSSPHQIPSRSFATSHSHHNEQSAPSGGRDNEPTPPSRSNPSFNAEFSRLLDSAISGSKKPSTAPNVRPSSPSTRNPGSFGTGHAGKDAGAIDEILEAMSNPQTSSPQRSWGSNNKSARFDISALLNPGPSSGAAATSAAINPIPAPSVPPPLPMKLNSSVGRTIKVDPARGIDVARAFTVLETQCNRNNVKRDAQKQRYHERPGLKRKRLKSERWRRRFKETFKRTVTMVQRMKGQGW